MLHELLPAPTGRGSAGLQQRGARVHDLHPAGWCCAVQVGVCEPGASCWGSGVSALEAQCRVIKHVNSLPVLEGGGMTWHCSAGQIGDGHAAWQELCMPDRFMHTTPPDIKS
eukprot:scaffold58867_cov19-Tisochrysis_lutea.AAC.3